jgi:ectoine hydroxylase-related dioxygenase (phytanoyl-CoA dioxygenase family)
VATLVASELVEKFAREGFVVVPDLLTDAELDHYGPAVDAAVATRQRHDHRSLTEKSRYEQSFQQCMNLWEDHPEVLPLTFHPRVGQVAAELLGADAVRLWHDQALYKEPGGRETDPHQDHPYWPIAEHDQVTAWIPFDGSSLETGAMAYVPGSHRVGLDRFVDIFGIFGSEPEDILAHPDVAATAPVLVEVPRGAVAFHHGLTVHLARPNSSDRVRRVHTIIYFRDGCTRGSPLPHPSVERNGIELGEPIAGTVTPIVWPRPDDAFPQPPRDSPA